MRKFLKLLTITYHLQKDVKKRNLAAGFCFRFEPISVAQTLLFTLGVFKNGKKVIITILTRFRSQIICYVLKFIEAKLQLNVHAYNNP